MQGTERRLISGDEAVAAAAARDAGVHLGTGYPGHPLHGDPRGPLRAGRPRAVGAQREGGPGGRPGRGLRRSPRPGDHEARRPERRRRPALHRRLHRRLGRPGGGLGRRPGHGLLAERAGQPPLRRRGRAAACSSRPTRRRPTTSPWRPSSSPSAGSIPVLLRMTTRVCHSKTIATRRAGLPPAAAAPLRARHQGPGDDPRLRPPGPPPAAREARRPSAPGPRRRPLVGGAPRRRRAGHRHRGHHRAPRPRGRARRRASSS